MFVEAASHRAYDAVELQLPFRENAWHRTAQPRFEAERRDRYS
ncbi:MAG: hypothetical protein AAGF12_00610 [Myxococcota bacterium]